MEILGASAYDFDLQRFQNEFAATDKFAKLICLQVCGKDYNRTLVNQIMTGPPHTADRHSKLKLSAPATFTSGQFAALTL